MKAVTTIKSGVLTDKANERQVRLPRPGLKIKTGIKAGMRKSGGSPD
jgi:hypothetical protein